MFDPSEPVRANGAVSVRDLARSAGSFLDQVEMNGDLFVVSRRGRMVAVLAPLPERTIVEIIGESRPVRAKEESERQGPAQTEWLELGPIEQAILLYAYKAHPMPFGVNEFAAEHGLTETDVALTELEFGGYYERDLRGRRLTRRGVAAARWLRAGLDGEAPAASS